MSWNNLLYNLEQQLTELTDGLWDEALTGNLHRRVGVLQDTLRRGYAWLGRKRTIIESLRQRLAENEKRLRQLAERVELYHHLADRHNSWKYALELDQARRALDRDAAELREREQIYQGKVAEIEQFKRRLIRLREQMGLQEHRPG